MECVGNEYCLGPGRRSGVDEPDIVVEDCLVRSGAVLSPVAGQFVVVVEDPSALEEVAEVVEAVIVEAVGVDGHRAVLQFHVIACPCQLVESVVEEHFADEGECVALVHAHVAEGVEGVGGLVVESAVAVEEDAVVVELHVAHQDLCGSVQALVEEEAVGMQQVHLAVGGWTVSGSLANRCHCHDEAETAEQGRTEDV